MSSTLEESLRANDRFFKSFIDMIPREIYKSEEYPDMNTKYFKHRRAPLSIDEKKILSQKRKNEKYGNTADKTEELDVPSSPLPNIPDFTKVSLSSKSKKAKINHMDGNQQQQQHHQNGKTHSKNKSNDNVEDDNNGDDDDDDIDIDFNEVKPLKKSSSSSTIPSSSSSHTISKDNTNDDIGKPGSKVRRLKRMLQEAQQKQQKLELLKQSGIEGKLAIQSELWTDALKEASGEKSVTDSQKLKKALKRIQQKKEKSSIKWKERVDAVNEAKVAKQEKRENNIKYRKTGGVDPSAAATTTNNSTTNGGSTENTNKNSGGSGKTMIKNPLHSHNNTSHHNNQHHAQQQQQHEKKKQLHKEHHRPGFEGKKKLDSKFLNQKSSSSSSSSTSKTSNHKK